MSRSRLAHLLGRRPASAAAVLALTFAATWFLYPWSDESVGDLGVRSSFAELMLNGELPYRDFAFEYPPLAAPAIALPGLMGSEYDAYRVGIAVLTFFLTVAVLLLAGSLARRTGGSAWTAMLAVAASPLLLGAVVRLHFDPLAVALTLGALVAVLQCRPGLGLTLVGLGAMTKGFPIVVAPVALSWLWAVGDPRGALRGTSALTATVVVCGVGWLALSPQGALDSVAYQLDRPLQLESSPATTLFAVEALGGEEPSVVQSHRSAGLEHTLDAVAGTAFGALLLVAVGALAALVARAARSARDGGTASPATARAMVLASLAAVAAFAVFGRVLSPQYLIWVVPLMALALAWRMYALAALSATACALTLAEFPSRYLDLLDGEPVAVAVVAARNAALVASVVAAGAIAWRMASGAVAAVGPGALTQAPAAPARSIEPARPAPPR